MEHVVQSVRLPNGIRLPFVERGARDGTPLVLLHGYTDSWRSFEGVLERLPTWIRAIVPTMRGHAGADAPETGYRPADFAGDVRQLLDVLRIERAAIAGHSFGSAVAQRFAIDHPERTTALVLMGSYITLKGCAEVQECWDKAVSTMTDPVDAVFARAFQESTLAREIPHDFLEMAVGESVKVPSHVWRGAMRDGMLDIDATDEISRISAPTLIIWGDRDLFMSREQQLALRARIARSCLVVHEEAGHAVHWEDPARVVSDIAGFVGEVTSPDVPEPARRLSRPTMSRARATLD